MSWHRTSRIPALAKLASAESKAEHLLARSFVVMC